MVMLVLLSWCVSARCARTAYAQNQNFELKQKWILSIGALLVPLVVLCLDCAEHTTDSFARNNDAVPKTNNERKMKAERVPCWFIYDYFSNEKWLSRSQSAAVAVRFCKWILAYRSGETMACTENKLSSRKQYAASYVQSIVQLLQV